MVVSGYWPSQEPYEELALPELLRRSAETFGAKKRKNVLDLLSLLILISLLMFFAE